MGRKRGEIPHGTNAGYSSHKRRGEDACGPCRAAHAHACRQARARARENGTAAKRVMIGVDLLAELFWAAPEATVDEMRRRYGDRLDEYVELGEQVLNERAEAA